VQAFSGDLKEQNNYLLLIQFALQLHDACGVRILGLNLVATDQEQGVRAFIKFQGWQVRFSESPHPSSWIQDSIAKSMKRLFAIQGINVDLEDWEFKVPALYLSLYSAQDDLNATGWQSVLRIIPWKSIWGLLASFSYCFFIPLIGFLLSLCYWKFSRKSKRHKDAHLSTSLFGSGLSLIFIGAITMGWTVFNSVQGALCSSEIKCEVMIRAGDRWALWREHAKDCAIQQGVCYTATEVDYMWSQSFSSECATCVCHSFRTSDFFYTGQKTCASTGGIGWAIVTAVIFILGFISIFVAVSRLQQQALVTTKRSSVFKFTRGTRNLRALSV